MDYYTRRAAVDKCGPHLLECSMRLLFVAALILAALASCNRMPVYPAAPEEGGAVSIPLTTLQEDRPTFFTFRAPDGKQINFFVLRKEGEVKSYLDACAKCFPQKLGYRAENGRVVCRACEVGYQHRDLKHGIGSCYPIKLAGAVVGPAYVIRKEDLSLCSRYF